MAKQRGYPDRRGMGAQSDFLAEIFVPSEQHKAQQLRMQQALLNAGMNAQELGQNFLLEPDVLRQGDSPRIPDRTPGKQT